MPVVVPRCLFQREEQEESHHAESKGKQSGKGPAQAFGNGVTDEGKVKGKVHQQGYEKGNRSPPMPLAPLMPVQTEEGEPVATLRAGNEAKVDEESGSQEKTEQGIEG